MLGFFGFIILFIFIIILIIFAFIGNILRFIFSFGRRTPQHQHYGQSQQAPPRNNASQGHVSPTKKKIFDEDEGEYVEFEEVK